jgi:hypothetical protein
VCDVFASCKAARAAAVAAQDAAQVQHSRSPPKPAGRRPWRRPARGHGS